MVGSTSDDHQHHHEPGDDDLDDGAMEAPSHGVSCSICLESITDNEGRSRAKLHCGHQFHLDCIGSAFNMKGLMQCPNCRKVEKGEWLYSNGSSRTLPEVSMEDWIPDEDFYDLSYAEVPFRVQWCPFGDFARVGSPFEEAESPLSTFHTPRGPHAIFTEHTIGSTVHHSYFGYVGSFPPAISRSSNNVEEPHPNHHWTGLPGHGDMFHPHALPGIHLQYHGWVCQSPPFSLPSSHISSTDSASVPGTLRSSHGDSDAVTVSRSYPNPFVLDHGAGIRAGSPFVSGIVPRHPGGSPQSHERIHASHASFHRHQQLENPPGGPTGARRFDGPRSMPTLVPSSPQPDQNGGFHIFPSTSAGQNPHDADVPLHCFNVWERETERMLRHPRDSSWGLFHPTGGGGGGTGASDSSNRSDSFWQRHSSP